MIDWFKPSQPTAKEPKTHVTSFLSNTSVSFFHAGPSKRQVLGQLIASLNLSDPNGALNAIVAREEAGSTVVAPGLALPHARIPGIKKVKAALGICPQGIVERRDSEPIKVFMLFLGPTDNMKEHLAFLAAVSGLFQTEGIVEELAKLATPAGVIEHLKTIEMKS